LLGRDIYALLISLPLKINSFIFIYELRLQITIVNDERFSVILHFHGGSFPDLPVLWFLILVRDLLPVVGVLFVLSTPHLLVCFLYRYTKEKHFGAYMFAFLLLFFFALRLPEVRKDRSLVQL